MQLIEWSWQRSNLLIILRYIAWQKLRRIKHMQKEKSDKWTNETRFMVSSVDPAHERLWSLQSLFVLQRLYFKDCLFRKFFSSFCHHDLIAWSSLSVVPVRTISGGPVRQWDLLPCHDQSALCALHICGEQQKAWRSDFLCSSAAFPNGVTVMQQQVGASSWTWADSPTGCDSLARRAADCIWSAARLSVIISHCGFHAVQINLESAQSKSTEIPIFAQCIIFSSVLI